MPNSRHNALAQVLQARDIAFAFYSGYSAPTLDPKFRKVPLIGKPTRISVINNIMTHLLADAPLVTSRL